MQNGYVHTFLYIDILCVHYISASGTMIIIKFIVLRVYSGTSE